MRWLDFVYTVVGRASLVFDWVRPAILRITGRHTNRSGEHDKTGLVAGADYPQVWFDDGLVIFAGYESLAHAFWRSQELTLLRKYKSELPGLLADFGCGDGVFASLVFDRIEYGIDNDPEAVAIARTNGVYSKVVQATGDGIPLSDGSLGSMFSNSVLEHVSNVEFFLKEIHRVLVRGGVFLATIPLLEFENHLARYFGLSQARRINEAYYHRNLFEREKWRSLFESAGFRVEVELEYQPQRFTYWYYMLRLCGRNGIGMFIPRLPRLVWWISGSRIQAAVRNSIAGVNNGANLLIIARKT